MLAVLLLAIAVIGKAQISTAQSAVAGGLVHISGGKLTIASGLGSFEAADFIVERPDHTEASMNISARQPLSPHHHARQTIFSVCSLFTNLRVSGKNGYRLQ